MFLRCHYCFFSSSKGGLSLSSVWKISSAHTSSPSSLSRPAGRTLSQMHLIISPLPHLQLEFIPGQFIDINFCGKVVVKPCVALRWILQLAGGYLVIGDLVWSTNLNNIPWMPWARCVCPGPGVQRTPAAGRLPSRCGKPGALRPPRAVPGRGGPSRGPGMLSAGGRAGAGPGARGDRGRCLRGGGRRRCGPMGSRAAGGEQPPGARPGPGAAAPCGLRPGWEQERRERDESLAGAVPLRCSAHGRDGELRLQPRRLPSGLRGGCGSRTAARSALLQKAARLDSILWVGRVQVLCGF